MADTNDQQLINAAKAGFLNSMDPDTRRNVEAALRLLGYDMNRGVSLEYTIRHEKTQAPLTANEIAAGTIQTLRWRFPFAGFLIFSTAVVQGLRFDTNDPASPTNGAFANPLDYVEASWQRVSGTSFIASSGTPDGQFAPLSHFTGNGSLPYQPVKILFFNSADDCVVQLRGAQDCGIERIGRVSVCFHVFQTPVAVGV